MAVPEIPRTPLVEGEWLAKNWLKYFQALKDFLVDIRRWTEVTATYTATHGDQILAKTDGGAFTITLPLSPKKGQTVYFHDSTANWNTANLTLDGNGKNVMGASTLVLSADNDTLGVVYNGTEWRRLY